MELPNQEFGELIRFVNKGREDKAKKIYEDKEPKGKEEIGKCEAPAKKVGRPLTDPKVLAKAVLTCEALGFTERKAQGWLEILGPFIGIHEKLDDRVIGNAYDKMEVAFILKQVFDNNKDSYGTDKKSTKEFMTSIVDSREIVQAFDFSGKDECRAMHTLIEEVEGESLRLDAGFNDRENW